jgi:hypothetical protein
MAELTIGERIRALRVCTQDDLAVAADVSVNAVRAPQPS